MEESSGIIYLSGKDIKNGVVVLKVRYIGADMVAMVYGRIYDVISIEKGWYRIMTEIHEDYLFPPDLFEIIKE